MEKYTYKFLSTESERAGMDTVKREVFVVEQGIPEEMVFAEVTEYVLYEVVALDGERVVGTARFILTDNNTAKLERMAVLQDYRGKGVGRGIVMFILSELKARSVASVFLHAQKTAVPFYTSCGFYEAGPWFMEVGIEHVQMEQGIG